MDYFESSGDQPRIALDAAIATAAVALAAAVIAGERFLSPWGAAWGYLAAVALSAWARSWLVAPIALASVVVPLACGDASPASSLAQALTLVVAIAVIGRVRRGHDALEDAIARRAATGDEPAA